MTKTTTPSKRTPDRRRPNDDRPSSSSMSRRGVRGTTTTMTSSPLLTMIPLLMFIAWSSSPMTNNAVVVVVASSTSDAVVSFRRVFDAVDANGDHSITEEEFAAAVDRLVGVGGGVGGDSPPAAVVVADSGGGGGGSLLEAPPLGMDANPSMFRPKLDSGGGKKKKGGGGGGGGGGKLDDPASTTAFVKGLISSFSAIMATEIGDKTFFIAAVLSMRNDRAAVFGGAILALVVMTVLSTLMGLVLPALMPRRYTHLIGGALFLYFGFKLLNDSRSMGNGVSEELEEVEEELAEMNKKRNRAKKKRHVEEKKGMDDDDNDDDVGGGGGGVDADDDVEGGGGTMGDGDNGAKKRRGGTRGGGGKFAKGSRQSSSGGLSTAGEYSGNSWESVFVQALTLTFLAEWGDRSQIATIALAAAKDPVGVTIGGCIGHSVCTGMAVMGGRMLASRISEKSVAFYGGLTFLVFGIHSVFFEE